MGTEAPKVTRKDLALMRAYLAADKTLPEIADETGWTRERIQQIREVLFQEDEPLVAGQRSEEIYMGYVLETRRNIRALREIFDELRGSNQGSAAVGAISACQKLLDHIIKTGQAMGFINREPVRHEHAHLIANMDDLALARYVERQVSELQSEIAAQSGRSLLDQIPKRLPQTVSVPAPPEDAPHDKAAKVRKIARDLVKRRWGRR